MKAVLIVPNFPRLSESFIVSKFLGLLHGGWDVHVLCAASDSAQMKNFPALQNNPEARRRVKVGWPHRPQWLAALLIPIALFCCFLSNPLGSWRYLRLGVKRFGFDVLRRFYLDADVIASKPDLVHFEFGTLAIDRMHLKELLNCKVIVSFRGYDLNYSGLEQPDYFGEVWAKADALHLLGEDLWRRAQQRGCPADKPHALIPPAVRTEFFKPGERNAGDEETPGMRPIRILSVGRLEWKKATNTQSKLVAFCGTRACPSNTTSSDKAVILSL